METLAEVFHRAQGMHSALKVSPLSSSSPEYQDQLRAAASLFQQASQMCKQASIFSDNETLEDMSTTDLKYVLLPFYQADLLLSTANIDIRRQCVIAAMVLLKGFMGHCESAQLLSPEAAREFHDWVASAKGKPVKATPVELRARKIAQFKRERALAAQLERMRKAKDARLAVRGILDDDEEEEDDEERDFVKTLIASCVEKALKHLSTGAQELVMLEHRAKMMAQQAQAPTRAEQQQQQQQRGQSREQLHSQSAQPSASKEKAAIWTIKSSEHIKKSTIPEHMQKYLKKVPQAEGQQQHPQMRQARESDPAVAAARQMVAGMNLGGGPRRGLQQTLSARQQVFRDANPYTITVDQWARGQQEQGLLPTAAESAAAQEEMARQAQEGEQSENENEDDEGVQEAATLKARDWDNWKDENVKGIGNTMK